MWPHHSAYVLTSFSLKSAERSTTLMCSGSAARVPCVVAWGRQQKAASTSSQLTSAIFTRVETDAAVARCGKTLLKSCGSGGGGGRRQPLVCPGQCCCCLLAVILTRRGKGGRGETGSEFCHVYSSHTDLKTVDTSQAFLFPFSPPLQFNPIQFTHEA